jgi:hypothetical protein
MFKKFMAADNPTGNFYVDEGCCMRGYRWEEIPPGAIWEVSVTPVGPITETRLEYATRFTQDGERLWSNGRIQLRPGYFRKDILDVGHETDDICSYCGSNNGPGGRDRYGYDCVYCGGN